MTPTLGQYTRSFITATPADTTSDAYLYYRKTIPTFAEESVYIYSFAQERMIYANGWKEVVGYEDEEINMLAIVNMSAPEFAPFSNELNDKALQFVQAKNEELEKYSFTIELKKIHKDGHEVPVVARVGVFEAAGGKVHSIIGRFQVNRSIKFGKVMRYAAYGPEKAEFEEELSKSLFQYDVISGKEKEALAMVAKGYSFKEIAHSLNVSHSAIEKRILPLYKRFNVRSLTHLVSFAYDNYILP